MVAREAETHNTTNGWAFSDESVRLFALHVAPKADESQLERIIAASYEHFLHFQGTLGPNDVSVKNLPLYISLASMMEAFRDFGVEPRINRVEAIAGKKVYKKSLMKVLRAVPREHRISALDWIEPVSRSFECILDFDHEKTTGLARRMARSAESPELPPRVLGIASVTLALVKTGTSIDVKRICDLCNVSKIRLERSLRKVATVTGMHWNELSLQIASQTSRERLIERSMRRNKNTTPDLCFYTPSETLRALQSNDVVTKWFQRILEDYEIPEAHIGLLVPCASQKPWGADTTSKTYQNVYAALECLDLREKVFILSISEPLGIVPEDLFDVMPMYDCPGLFKRFVEKHGLVWSDDHFMDCISTLGSIVGQFLTRAQSSFPKLHAIVRESSTHKKILQVARSLYDLNLELDNLPFPLWKDCTQMVLSLQRFLSKG